MRYLIAGLVKIMNGIRKSPNYTIVWVAWLIGINLLVPIFFWNHPEARVIAVVFLAGGTLMGYLTTETGFSRLLGLGHVFWYPLLIWLALRMEMFPAAESFGLWIRVLMVTNAISLVIDTADVIRWLRGDRAEMVELT